MEFNLIEEDKFKYIETKTAGPNLMLLHGLFGALSNFEGILNHFKGRYNVIIPR